MSFFEAANHPLIYVMVACGITFVAGFAIVSMAKSWKRARAKGYSTEKLMTIVRASVSATIIPALAVVIGLFSLVALLGIPWPWWRLSVVGSVTYETMAADQALKAMGLDLTRLSEATVKDFVLVMFVMSIGIMGGMFVSPFVTEKIQFGSMKIKSADKAWGALGGTVFFLVILAVFVVPMCLDYKPAGLVKLLTLVTSGVVTIIIDRIARGKLAVLRSFTLALSLILSMASSVLWSSILIQPK